MFIETIPYRETCEYVTRVEAFSVIYDWRLNGQVRPLSSRLAEQAAKQGVVLGIREGVVVQIPVAAVAEAVTV